MKKMLLPLVLLVLLVTSYLYMGWSHTDVRKDIVFVTKTIEKKDGAKNLRIYAEYPQISGTPKTELISGVVRSFVESRISDFEKSSNDASSSYEYSFSLRYATSVPSVAPDLMGMYFVEESDLGGAHPGHDITTFHYNLRNGKEIGLGDIFEKKDFLAELASVARRALSEKLGTYASEQIEEGAGPELENFRAFVITDGGLRLLFNEYQVAAYAAGVQDVLIPWSELEKIINKDVIVLPK